ncbi:MAG: hypothetical protein LH629_04830 [Ignavibacteria bacterium]|nr:hypothetical protein [Ignavibacteria bacterium]
MKKKIFIPAILIIAIFTALVINKDLFSNPEALPLPNFNVRVLQTTGSSPVENAQVRYWTGEVNVYTGITLSDGWCNVTLATGTYDVYVYYPAKPNDGQSSSLLSYNHDGNDSETLRLIPNY